jgi:hypothetical protein
VMRLREGEQVATLAPVIGSDDEAEPDDSADPIGAGESEPEATAVEPPA